MAIEDTFNGAKNAFVLLTAYINTVAQEIGMERAIALDTKVCETMGTEQGKMMKEQAGIKKFDVKAAHPLARNAIEQGFGISSEVIEENSQKVMYKVGKCPIYEAGKMLGLDDATIEAQCHAGSITFMDNMVKQFNPRLSCRLNKFRSTADDFCEEEIFLS